MTLAFSAAPGDTARALQDAAQWHVARCELSPELAREWDALADTAAASPYQSRGWVMAYARHVAPAAGQELALVAIRDTTGKLAGLLPFTLARARFGRVAGFAGDKHANYHMGLFAPDYAATLDRRAVHRLLRAAAAAIGPVDALVFINQPRLWQGAPNPLAAAASWTATQPAYALSLLPSAEAAMERAMSTHARKSLRGKRKKLAAAGEAQFVTARTREEISVLAQAFRLQKAERFRQLALPDPFSQTGVMEMLVSAALAQGDVPPAIVWHGLTLNGRIAAVFIGAVDARRYSGMTTSFAAEEAIARLSPGECLLGDLILAQGAEGRSWFDLGVGEARYKTTFCDVPETMVETVRPFTPAGWLIYGERRARHLAKAGQKALMKRAPSLAKAMRRWLNSGDAG